MKIDHISGATTFYDGAGYWRNPSRKLPAHVVGFLAENNITVPADGQFISLTLIDQALQGETLETRFRAKSELRGCNLIAP